MAENANFSVKALLTRANVSRGQFRRFFSGKAELLSALAGEDVKDLSGILEEVQPVAHSLKAAVGAEAQPVPVTDAWLERRLRVFERALAAMEKRQENAEQNFARGIALLGEKLDAFASQPAPEALFAPPPPEMSAAELAPETATAAAPIPEPAPAPESPKTADLAPAVLAHVEEIAGPDSAAEPVEEKVSEKDISDFLAHARQAARNAALAVAAPRPKARNTPWLAWGGAAAVLLLLLGMGLLLVGRAVGHAAPPVAAGLSHRHVAQSGLPRVIALADSGDARAEAMLALAYLRGEGVTGDEAAAMRWSLAAATQGQPVAEYLLGTFYLEGDRDDGQAVRWFQAAAAQGNIKSMHNLAIAYAEGLGVDKDPVQAVSWFARAAQQGYRDSEFDLAVLYERGLGVPQDAAAALKWYLIAASRGDAPSAARAQFLKTQLDADEVNAASGEAAAFAPQPVGSYANEISLPGLQGQGLQG